MGIIAIFTPKTAILFFLTKKPLLRELMPPDYTDIHSHLIPGIDDGSKTIDETVKLITGLREIGFGRFITTPHIMPHVWDNTRQSIQQAEASTREALKAAGHGMPFKAASEYLMDGNFSEALQREKLLVLKDNFILVEMSYINPPIQLMQIIFDIQLAGYVPVLAHPERYAFYHSNFGHYEKLRNSGCLFQLNLLSTIGYYGANVADVAKKLLKRGMIDYTGSDVHHKNHVAGFHRRVVLKKTAPLEEAMRRNDFFRF